MIKPVEWKGSLAIWPSSNLGAQEKESGHEGVSSRHDFIRVHVELAKFPLFRVARSPYLYLERPSWVTMGKGESRSSSTVVVRKSLYLSSRILSQVSH